MKKIFTNARVIILFIMLFLSIYAINYQFNTDGAAIRQVSKDSAASLAGVQPPQAGVTPTQREIVTAINGFPIKNATDYYNSVNDLVLNQTVLVQTDKQIYRFIVQPITIFNNLTNQTETIGVEDLGLSVYDAPTSNIRKGLDLSGGTRVILKPEHHVVKEDLDLVIDNIKERLNVFGLSDIIVRSAQDLNREQYIIVEIAGANKEEVRELLGNQGVFEAKVGNTTVFSGGDDITFVCRSPECSGINTRSGGCQPTTTGDFSCRFSFSITLSDSAAKRQADATELLTISSEDGGSYLSEPLDLYLDGELVDSLSIAADLKGRTVTNIQISGSGTGIDKNLALDDALANMKQLQTILITGSLPVKLQIVKTDAISPVLGSGFVKNAILMALAAIIAVASVIFIKYRKLSISIPMFITMISEGIIILGFASFVGWNLDLAAIAGIIIAIGTGVDDQIVIVDETMRGESSVAKSWKERMSRAFFIIFASYATTVVAMLPLWFAGAGLLRGFAITTIVGVTAGVFITRPAFAAVIEFLIKE